MERELCNGCGAHRRLDEKKLCYKCAVDPVRLELATLRKRVKEFGAEALELKSTVRRLRDRLSRRNKLVKELRKRIKQCPLDLDPLQFSEYEQALVVSVLIDVCYEDDDPDLLSLLDKLRRPAVDSIPLSGVVPEESSGRERGRTGGAASGVLGFQNSS